MPSAEPRDNCWPEVVVEAFEFVDCLVGGNELSLDGSKFDPAPESEEMDCERESAELLATGCAARHWEGPDLVERGAACD